MTKVNVRTLKDRLSEYLDRARKGEAIEVIRHGTPVALLIPPPAKTDPYAKLRALEAEGTLTIPKNPPGWSKTPPMKLRTRKTLAEMVIEDRRSSRY